MIYYFAFGSNLKQSRLEERVGKVIALGRAELPGWDRAMNHLGGDDTYKANIVPRSDRSVWGALYELTEEQIDKLDPYEPGYRRIRVEPVLDDGRRLVAYTYVSHTLSAAGPASTEYRQYMINGAREHGLPEEIVTQLESVRVVH